MRRLLRRINRYFGNRDKSLILPAIPALLVIGVWIFFAFFLMGWGTEHTEARYRELGGRAWNAKNFETARVAYWRLATLKSDKRSEYLFYLAMNLLGLNRDQEAQGILAQLAPLDRPGYGEAHLFIAQRLLTATNAPPEARRLAERHLLRAVEGNPKLTDAHNILGQIYTSEGNYQAAKKHLLEVVPVRGEANLLLAVVLRSLGDLSGANAYAERAVKYFAEKVSQSAGDDSASRLGWANAELMLKRYDSAMKVVQDGYRASGNPAYRSAIGSLYGVWAQALGKEHPEDISRRLELVQSGLEYTPQSDALLRELVALTSVSGPQAEVAQQSIARKLAEGGTTAAMLHFFLGMECWNRDKKQEAEHHFALAFESSSNVPTVANNMAMILTMGDKPDYDRALSIIQPVLDRYPENAGFRSTRGLILLKLKRYKDAAGDLERALPYLTAKRTVRLQLAEAYRGLGLENLAKQQELLANPDGTGAKP
jgi:tetratricopeptide (TPR) repeat protein